MCSWTNREANSNRHQKGKMCKSPHRKANLERMSQCHNLGLACSFHPHTHNVVHATHFQVGICIPTGKYFHYIPQLCRASMMALARAEDRRKEVTPTYNKILHTARSHTWGQNISHSDRNPVIALDNHQYLHREPDLVIQNYRSQIGVVEEWLGLVWV